MKRRVKKDNANDDSREEAAEAAEAEAWGDSESKFSESPTKNWFE